MKKILEKSLNNVLVLLVILNLVSYQIILPISISRAEDTGGEAVESVSESSSSDSSAQADEEEEEDADEAEAQEDASTEEAQAEEADDEAAPAATDEVPAVTEELAPASSEEPVVVQETVLPSGEESVEENADVCACRNVADENDNNEQESCPSDCACCQPESCDSCVTQEKVAEDVAITVEADSQTGGNTISGEVATDPTVAPAEQASGDNNDNNSGNEASENDNDNEEDKTAATTGDAVAVAVTVNEINTNIYTENGVEYEKTITGDYAGDINLIEAFDEVIDNAQKLNEENEQAFEAVTVNNVNVAKNIETNLSADASSGDNLVEALDSVAEVATGSAEALASAVNFVNTNIVGNNWILAKINNFGNWTGDLIVPGEGLFDLPSAGMVFDQITNTNLAQNVLNFISAQANSGDNSISDVTGDVTAASGDAVAIGDGVNMINTNIVKNNWFFLMINNAGNWTGQVFNWNNGNQELAYEYNFGSLEGVDTPVTKSVSVNNYNSAEDVTNSVSASASSGGNVISGVDGAVTAVTGDAIARASAFNFINTNIVGNNWFMAVVNNAGNWSGDLIFGYPDLAADLSADKSALQPGDRLNYAFTYRNNGQAKCGNVELMLSLPEQFIYQADSVGFSRRSGNDFYWSVAGLKPGEQKTINLSVLLDPKTIKGPTALKSVAGVRTNTQEINLADNYASEETSLIFLTNSTVTISDAVVIPEKQAKLSIERFDDASVAVGSISTHSISVSNSGKSTLYNLEVKEAIKNPDGEKMVEYIWPIEELKKGKTMVIEYQIFAGPELALGNYRHSASAKGVDQYGREVESEKASALVAFFRPASEAVALGNTEEDSALSAGTDGVTEVAGTAMPEILGMASEARNINWQWLLLLLLVPVAYYVRKEKVYRWEKIQKFSRQMGSFLSSFL